MSRFTCAINVIIAGMLFFPDGAAAQACSPPTSVKALPEKGKVGDVCYNGEFYIMATGRSIVKNRGSILEARDIAAEKAEIMANAALAEWVNGSNIITTAELKRASDDSGDSASFSKSIRSTMQGYLQSGVETVRFMENDEYVIVGAGIKTRFLIKGSAIEALRGQAGPLPPAGKASNRTIDWIGSGWKESQ